MPVPSQSIFSTIWKPGSRIVEADPDEQRHDEGDDRRPQRDRADVAARALALVADEQDEQHADQRQEGDQRQDGPSRSSEAAPEHHPGDERATPISMAKA